MDNKELDNFIEEKIDEFMDLPFTMPYRERLKDFFCTLLNEALKPKVTQKWIGKFTHDVFVFDPTEKYTLYDFLRDKIKEIAEVEE